MIKSFLKSIINLFGYQISLKSDQGQAEMFNSALIYFKIDMIIDVGANQGQTGLGLRHDGYKGKILSFEPLKNEYNKLLNVSNNDPLWTIAPRCAIGNFDGDIDINIAGNSGSSSILPMMDIHTSAAPNSTYIGIQNVPIYKLDSIYQKYIDNHSKSILLKIDTQGFEWEVLDGSTELLKIVTGVTLELSFAELYAGQKLWIDIVNRLESLGFKLWSIYPGFSDNTNGRMLQIDATFYKKIK